MHWRIIFQLSIFGLVMAFGTVSLIPQGVEPVCWFLISVFCAVVIGKQCNRGYFLHGFLTGAINCIWITTIHVIYFEKYMQSHTQLDSMMERMPQLLAGQPKLAMAFAGLILGLVAAVALGLFAFLAAKLTKKR